MTSEHDLTSDLDKLLENPWRSVPSRNPDILTPAPIFHPISYFFYGSLMDPSRLIRVAGLGQSDRPIMRPASLIGYSCKMWGPYPALVEGPPDAVVYGVTYEVKSQDVAARLAYYETTAYEEHACTIYLEGGEKVSGVTFKWRGNADDENLREGVFSLQE